MKILLLGEFSSLHKYLKQGLIESGHEVILAADGDGWKQIDGADMPFTGSYGKGIKHFFVNIVNYWNNVKQFQNFDVVQILDPLPYPCLVNLFMLKIIKKQNRLLSLVSAGGDYALVRAYKAGKFDYYICDYDDKYVRKYSGSLKGAVHALVAKKVEDLVDVIIPIHYEYSLGYTNNERLTKVIPCGIDLTKITYNKNIVRDKIVFFHGINDELKKGTPFIREALKRLMKKYPDKVEVIIDGHMPFDKYVDVMNKANIVIDQCCSYAYGINAMIAMAQGKVVMAGARKETTFALGANTCPIIHISPDIDQIYEQLLYIVDNVYKIEQMGIASRKYVETYHDCIKIAKEYVHEWEEKSENK